MADLYSSDLGGNSRKAQPSSTFGTRNLQFLSLSVTGYDLFHNNSIDGSYTDPQSLYSRLVRSIQKVAEIYYLGNPTEHKSSESFVFAISSDTATWYYSEGVNDYPEQDTVENRPNSSFGTLVDQLAVFFASYINFPGETYYGEDIWNLAPLVDTGFGLMPGESLNYLQN
jgi:hypothetical protein